jgi:hypothetical protein
LQPLDSVRAVIEIESKIATPIVNRGLVMIMVLAELIAFEVRDVTTQRNR